MRHVIWLFSLCLALARAQNQTAPKVGLLSSLPYTLSHIGGFRSYTLSDFLERIGTTFVRDFNYFLEPSTVGTADQNVKFNCSSRGSPTPQLYVNQSSTFQFNFSLPTYFFVHGYIDGYSSQYGLLTLGPAELLKYEDCNVCAVDWSPWAYTDYISAINFVFPVGTYVAQVLQELQSRGLNFDDVTLIGHSLGAHVAGWAGRTLNGTIGRIIGTDPAGPGFCPPLQIVPDGKRLDSTCAKYVQTIPTTPGTVGCVHLLGHANFVADLGFLQPACTLKFITCNHYESNYYLISSFNPANQFVGVECKDVGAAIFDDIVPSCDYNNTDIVGLRAARKPGNFFFRGANTWLPTPYTSD